MEIQYRHIRQIATIYIALPLIVFVIGWLNIPLKIIGAIAVIIATYYVLKNVNEDNYKITIDKKFLIILFVIIFIWLFMSGIGGYFYQTSDFDCRNAVFRDLIQNPWPVKYSNGGLLTYYIGFWLVPAAITKVFAFVGFGADLVWTIGNFLLFIWSFIGLFITYVFLIGYLKKNGRGYQLIVLLIFIFFSGLDIIGVVAANAGLSMHLEWWAKLFQFSSNTTQLYWVFNQAIPAWIATLLIISSKSLKNDIYFGVVSLICAPFSMIGCAIIGFGKLVNNIKETGIITQLKEMLSKQCIISLLLLFPVLAIYLTQTSSLSSSDGGLFQLTIQLSSWKQWAYYVLFLLLECGCYQMVLFSSEKKNYLYICTIVALPVIAIIKLGGKFDFTMRSSIPLLFVLMIYVMKHIINGFEYSNGVFRISKQSMILVCFIVIGSVTPIIEMYRGYTAVRTEHRLGIAYDTFKTFEGYDYSEGSNFVTIINDSGYFSKYVLGE